MKKKEPEVRPTAVLIGPSPISLRRSTLILEEYPEQNMRFLEQNNIKLLQFGVAGNKEPFVDIPEDKICLALAAILGAAHKRNLPMLLHCNKGKVSPDGVPGGLPAEAAALVVHFHLRRVPAVLPSKVEVNGPAIHRAVQFTQGVVLRGRGASSRLGDIWVIEKIGWCARKWEERTAGDVGFSCRQATSRNFQHYRRPPSPHQYPLSSSGAPYT
ncbi:MAG: hypothetical protein BJ554DRAFT_3689 [Olpidium bornovanus]|uniref:Uncharacterized protein n=1 Tax=Olpidium bornovanus TaxID=278681 RepID=A0A8H7ZP32_9FUNG|nr:MAG: hypothetical protein BJ554DRAFT_3689 [Olpidium bornovanus]